MKNKLILILLIGFIGLQFFRPKKIDQGMKTEHLVNVPKEIDAILRNSCFDCHSSEVNLRWYDEITPANFLVNSHVRQGREVLDFSKWNSWPEAKQNSTIYYSLNKILSGEMPVPSYAWIHSSAKLNKEQIRILKDYALSLSSKKPSEAPFVNGIEKQNDLTISNEIKKPRIKAAPNGLQYIPDYRNWKAISITDRFDNGTMRIIFGNDIAVKAIQDGKISSWPDGSILAKAAWKQNLQKDGNSTPGEFIQVEFMVKDAKKYAATKGWGWGRWKGNDLKPYGETSDFDKECIECHRPVAKQDYTFTSPLYLISQLKKNQTK